MFSEVNLKKTGLKEFWLENHTTDLFLCHGTLNGVPIDEIKAKESDMIPDPFKSAENYEVAHKYCKELYYKYVEFVSKWMNTVHGINYSTGFCHTSMGYWLYKHICAAYDKFLLFEQLDLRNCSFKVLDEQSYFVPFNNYDSFYCTSSDFGVEQFFSLYTNHFFKDLKLEKLNYKFEFSDEQKELANDGGKKGVSKASIKSFLKKKLKGDPEKKIKVAMLGAYFPGRIMDVIRSKTDAQVDDIELPSFKLKEKSVDMDKRLAFESFESSNKFEEYLNVTLKYFFPKFYLEYFDQYHTAFLSDLKKRKFTHLVSESWLGYFPVGLYAALVREQGLTFICYEHAANSILFKHNNIWLFKEASDKLITVGWNSDDENVVEGGFASRNIPGYEYSESKNETLYVGTVKPSYMLELTGVNPSNSRYFDQLDRANGFLEALPELKDVELIYRPRSEQYLWDTYPTLKLKERGLKLDTKDFHESLFDAKLVVLDHISTVLAELALNKIPFLLLFDKEEELIKPEYKAVFEKFEQCGILHKNGQQVVNQLNQLGNDVWTWWTSEEVREAVEFYLSQALQDSKKTINYLVSLCN